MNELIMPHNVGVKNAVENMKEVLALYKKVIGNYRPLLDGERYLTDKEVSQILKISRRTLILQNPLLFTSFFSNFAVKTAKLLSLGRKRKCDFLCSSLVFS